MQDESASNQHGGEPHGWEIPPKYENLSECFLKDPCLPPLRASLSLCYYELMDVFQE
jgi:hypothetical protein